MESNTLQGMSELFIIFIIITIVCIMWWLNFFVLFWEW